jgi:hypothetical protein
VSDALLLGQVLAEKAVGVLAGAAFPRVVRSREVEAGAGRGLDRFVAMELGAVVDGDGTDASLGASNQADGPMVGGLGVPSLELTEQEMGVCG